MHRSRSMQVIDQNSLWYAPPAPPPLDPGKFTWSSEARPQYDRHVQVLIGVSYYSGSFLEAMQDSHIQASVQYSAVEV